MEIQQSIQQKINIEDNNEAIEYYEYLRQITQITDFSYWIGNPSVQIISGKIILEPFAPIKSKKQPESFELYLKQILKTNTYQQKNMMKESSMQKNNIQNEKKEFSQEQSPSKRQSIVDPKIKSRCLVLCGIPNSKSPVQVMEAQCISRNKHLIKQIRVIKTVHIRYYGMLLLMQNEQCASEFFNQLFGCQYNDLEMQRIIIRQIKSITLTFSQLSLQDGKNQMNLLRQIRQDSEFVAPQNIFMTYHHQRLNQKINANELKRQNFSELVCAICFQQCNKEAISILCGHYFDLQCLQKWSENICPLCRYHQQPPIIKFCEQCNQCQGLWVCLICGSRLCCGANNDILGQDSHIYKHYQTTSHSLSMELQTKFLFDAKIPAFLHQKFYRDLIHNKREQKIMMQQKNMEQNTKKDKITQQIQQYESQVSEQMKKQRLYFEEQINKSVKEHRNTLSTKRTLVQLLRSQIQQIDLKQKTTLQQIKDSEHVYQQRQKQLQIVKKLIKMKFDKVTQKKEKFKANHNLKAACLRQLENQIRQKRQELLNYRKNLKLRQKITHKLKGQQVEGEIVVIEQQQKQKNPKKKKKAK